MLHFTKAQRDSDKALREFLNKEASGGAFGIRLIREPSYFDALEVEGIENDCLAAYDGADIIGVATRSEKRCFVNGVPTIVGYLGDLRITSQYRQGHVLKRGFGLLKNLHSQGNSSLYLTTIISDNITAIKTLTSRRAGLPAYKAVGEFVTYVLDNKPRMVSPSIASLKVRRARTRDVPAIVQFISEHGSRKQFFPVYTENDIINQTGLLRALRPNDILLAIMKNKIVGTLAIWNQTSFRNWKSELKGELRFLSLVCVQDDKACILQSLLDQALCELSRVQPSVMAVIGFHESDPLGKIVTLYQHFQLRSQLFVVHWEDGGNKFQSLDKRIPYLEIGGL